MKCLNSLLLIIPLFFITQGIFAQDKIYFKKGKTEGWKVNEITAAYIKGTDINNPRITYSVSQPDLLFVVNSKGNFLVIPQLFDSKIKSESYISYYLNYTSDAFEKQDRIITRKNTFITCAVTGVAGKEIQFTKDQSQQSISKADVNMVIYKDGSHQLFAPVEKVYASLKSIQDNYYQYCYPASKPGDTARSTEVGGRVDYTRKEDLVVSTGVKFDSTLKETVAGISTLLRSGNRTDGASELDPSTRQLLQDKAMINIKELESFLTIICNKNTADNQRSKATTQALLLFASDDAKIEVSSKKTQDIQQYSVKVYLNRLGFLQYDKVLIEWYNLQYVSKVRKNPDGTYSGFIEFEQRFTAMRGDKRTYQDITRKTIEILIKPYYKQSGGETSVEWDVFLGNIGISVS